MYWVYEDHHLAQGCPQSTPPPGATISFDVTTSDYSLHGIFLPTWGLNQGLSNIFSNLLPFQSSLLYFSTFWAFFFSLVIMTIIELFRKIRNY